MEKSHISSAMLKSRSDTARSLTVHWPKLAMRSQSPVSGVGKHGVVDGMFGEHHSFCHNIQVGISGRYEYCADFHLQVISR